MVGGLSTEYNSSLFFFRLGSSISRSEWQICTLRGVETPLLRSQRARTRECGQEFYATRVGTTTRRVLCCRDLPRASAVTGTLLRLSMQDCCVGVLCEHSRQQDACK